MTDDGRLPLQLADDVLEMVGDLLDRLAGEDFRLGARFFDRLRVVRPARCERRVAGLLEEGLPPVPTAGKQPQTVNEDDGRTPGSVRVPDLLILVLGDRWHSPLLQSTRMHTKPEWRAKLLVRHSTRDCVKSSFRAASISLSNGKNRRRPRGLRPHSTLIDPYSWRPRRDARSRASIASLSIASTQVRPAALMSDGQV